MTAYTALSLLDHKLTEYTFIITFWIGVYSGYMSTYSFFKGVSNLTIRGMVIVALLLPG